MPCWRRLSGGGVCQVSFRAREIGLPPPNGGYVCLFGKILSGKGLVVRMLTAVAVILSLALIGWLIWRAAKRRPIKAHMVMYVLSWLAGIFTLSFFLSMDIDRMIKILVSIILGAALIFLAAYLQRRQLPKAD